MRRWDRISAFILAGLAVIALQLQGRAQTDGSAPAKKSIAAKRSAIAMDSGRGAAPSTVPGLRRLLSTPETPSKPASATAVLQRIQEKRIKAAGGKLAPGMLALPTAYDNSAGLPPVRDQGNQGSCASWATGYYMKSFQEGKEHGWSLIDPSHQFSPAFLYNQLQQSDEGSTIEDNLDLLAEQGCASLATMPYSGADHLTWPSAGAYREGIPYRALSYDYLGNGEAQDIFPAIKAIISLGDLCVVNISVFRPGLYAAGRFEQLTAGDCEYDMPAPDDVVWAGYHDMAIVGYDESRFGGAGGYKVVNSWGSTWGNGGFAWISQRYLMTYGSAFYCMTDRTGYTPSALVHFKVGHPYWWYDDVHVTIGVGDEDAPVWSKAMNRQLNRYGVTVDRWADITEGAAYLPPELTRRWWIKVEDHSNEDVATLSVFDIEWNGQVYSANAVLPLYGPYFAWGADLLVYVPAGDSPTENYYVNDESRQGDLYCSALGNDANDGLTPGTPKRSVQEIIDTYTLQAGDTVWIDSGTYVLTSDIVVNYLDRGTPDNPVRFVGASSGGEPLTVIDRGRDGGVCLRFYGNPHVRLENLSLRGGGIYDDGFWSYASDRDKKSLELDSIGISGGSLSLQNARDLSMRHCRINPSEGSTAIDALDSIVSLENCVVVTTASATSIVYVASWSSCGVSIKNSIVRASGNGGRCIYYNEYAYVPSAQYSDFFAADGATIGFLPGAMNLTVDPLFANPANGDFHLKSSAGRWNPAASGGNGGWTVDAENSPCIDAGDPRDICSVEQVPNGGRNNIGAYGDTPYASLTPDVRFLALISPGAGLAYRTRCDVSWTTRWAGWKPGDTLRLEYSSDGGTTYHTVAGAESLPYWRGSFDWDIRALTAGSAYVLRLICSQNEMVCAATTSTFSIQTSSTYYVNDGHNAAVDVYCTAAGSDANDGLTASTPKASIQAVLDAYDLEPGDTVYVDTGTYLLSSNIIVSASDAGSSTGYVYFKGSPRGTVIDRQSTESGACCWDVQGGYVWIEGFTCMGADTGISVTPGATANAVIAGNVIRGNRSFGIVVRGPNYGDERPCCIRNNVLYDNGGGVWLGGYDFFEVANNTIASGGIGIGIDGAPGRMTFRNNVIVCSGSGAYCLYGGNAAASSDYNVFVYADGAKMVQQNEGGYIREHGTLLEWQELTGWDRHSANTDPLFGDAASGDYHVKSTGGRWNPATESWVTDGADSPCIDAGDPSYAVGSEPTPNGSRINIGAYGGTAEASKSPSGRILTLLSPNGGEVWKGINEITWLCAGHGWLVGDTVRIQCSTDGGATWAGIAGATTISYSVCEFWWDTSGLPSSPLCRIRITCNGDPATQDTSDRDFTIHNSGRAYYVNDSHDPATDVYCTAAGDNANTGLTPSAPKASIQGILDAYDLESGDTVYVDTGTYLLSSNTVISASDAGTSAGYVHFKGSPKGTVVDRESKASGAYCWEVRGGYIWIDGFKCTGARTAIYVNVDRGTANASITDNLIWGNSSYGIAVAGNDYGDEAPCWIRNNVLYNGGGIWLSGYDFVNVVNNTIYSAGIGVTMRGTPGRVTLRNNVIACSGSGAYCLYGGNAAASSDYNVFVYADGAKMVQQNEGGYIRDHATLLEWQNMTRWDMHSTTADPLFADPANGDFHLKSTGGRWNPATKSWATDAVDSPCIDVGDPSYEVGSEAAPNGNRINVGAYGGTAEASKSPSGRVLTLLSPNGGEVWKGVREILWLFAGQAWQAGDTVRIEYSTDAGATWIDMPRASAIPYLMKGFSWDMSTLPASPLCRVRIVCNEHPATEDESDGSFAIHNGGQTYYVNDGYDSTKDVYCTAAGSDGNSGLTAGAPKASIQGIVDTYDLEPGDTVYVDTGTYLLSSNIVVSALDAGSSAGYVYFRGSPKGTVIDRQSTESGAYCWEVHGGYVWIEGFTCTGAETGVSVTPETTANAVIAGNVIRGNGSFGIVVRGPNYGDERPCRIRNNVLYDNGGGMWLGGYDFFEVANNTISSGGIDIGIDGTPGRVTFRNNVIVCSGSEAYCLYGGNAAASSDYNVFVYADGAKMVQQNGGGYGTLLEWQELTGWDRHSVNADPLFADAASGDYHVKSTGGRWNPATKSWVTDGADSPCIDAGDPSYAVGDEATPNGSRINIGAYGGTAEASKSPSGRVITLLSPNGGEVWKGIRTIGWVATGSAWQSGDSVTLYYSANSGADWQAIPGGAGICYGADGFEWNLCVVSASSQYRVKAICDQNGAAWDASDSDFTVQTGGAYYVNDAYDPGGDVYCTAAGNNANNGLTAGTPKASVQAILDAYTLGPGDVVFVDSGTYNLSADLNVTGEDGGSALTPMTIRGVKGKTIVDRGAGGAHGSNCIKVEGNYVALENLTCRNGGCGIFLSRGSGCLVRDNIVTGCVDIGICIDGAQDARVVSNVVVHSGSGHAIGIVANGYWGFVRIDCSIRNNTLLTSNANGIEVYANEGPMLANNIIHTSGADRFCILAYDIRAISASDSNDLYATDGAKTGKVLYVEAPTLADWRYWTGWDVASISTDPRFADEAGGDYHLKSAAGRWSPTVNGGAGGWVIDDVTSPCIDMGDPGDGVGEEPMPNGRRINQGAYGGTSMASKSPSRWVSVDVLGDGEPFHAWEPLRWSTRGTDWTAGETVRIEYSDDSGLSWHSVTGAEHLGYAAGLFWWDTRTVSDGDHYRFRVTANSAPVVGDTSMRDYSIHNLQAPWGPDPRDGAIGVSVHTALSWHCAWGAATYDIFVWQLTEPKPSVPTASALAITAYNPPMRLASNTLYNWQVVARNTRTTTGGPVWTFTTAVMPPEITTAGLASGEVGIAYCQSMTAIDGVLPYAWSIQSGSLPAGLSLDVATGAITGTPTASGTSNFTVRVTDTLEASATRALSIVVNATLTITTTDLPSCIAGAAYCQTLTAAGGVKPYVWSVYAGNLPAGLSLGPGGVLKGTPTASGRASFTVRVSDARSPAATATRALSIGVAPPGPTYQFAANDSETWTTSTGYISRVSLSFTPPAADDWIIFGFCEFRCPNANYATFVQLFIDGAGEGQNTRKPVSTTDYLPFITVKVKNLSAGAHSVQLMFKSGNSSTAAYVRNARICAVRRGSLEFWSVARDSGVPLTSALTDTIALNWTPTATGNYLVISTAEINATTAVSTDVQTFCNGTLNDEGLVRAADNGDFTTFMSFNYLANAAAGVPISHKIAAKKAAPEPANHYIRRARILALRLTGDRFRYAAIASANEQSTTQTAFQQALSATWTCGSSGKWLLLNSARLNNSSIYCQTELRVQLNDIYTCGQQLMKPKHATDLLNYSSIDVRNLAASPRRVDMDWRTTNTAGTAKVRRLRFYGLPLDAQ